MFETMLTIDELSAMDELDAYTLHDAEVKRLPRLTREQDLALVERARQGDEEARHALVLDFARYASIMAHRYFYERQPEHIDILDLIQEAHLAMLEKLDYALACEEPISYIATIAARAISSYCTYHAPMIQRPREALKILPPPTIVESLDTTIYDSLQLRIEHIEAPALRLEAEEEVEQRKQYRFAPLYEAIKHSLGPQQRATIIRLFGLFGQPAETIDEIAKASHLQYITVSSARYRACKRLRVALAEHLSEMLSPTPSSEED